MSEKPSSSLTSTVAAREVDPLLQDLNEKKQSFRRNVVSLAVELKELRSRLASQEQSYAKETQTRQEAETNAKNMELQIGRLQKNLEERNEQLQASASSAEKYLKELDDLRTQLVTTRATADASAASAQSAQLQCLELVKELNEKNGSLREHEDRVLRLGEQLDNLQKDLQARESSQKQLKDEVLRIEHDIMEALAKAGENKNCELRGAMMNSSPPPAKRLSKYAPLIHVMKVRPDRINLIIGSGGKKVKSIIEESGVDTIDTEDDGTVKIFAKDLPSLEKSKAIINSLTMVPTIGDIYRSCEIKSIASYGVFVEIAPGREGLCHISELSSGWLPKAEDVFKVGDRIDVKLIEINEKGQLRLSHRALLPDTEASPKDGLVEEKTEQSKDKSSTPNVTASSKRSSEDDSVLPSKKFVRRLVSSSLDKPFTNKDKTKKSSNKAVGSVSGKDESSLVSGEA